MALGRADVLFTIRGDSKQAREELDRLSKKSTQSFNEIEKSATDAGDGFKNSFLGNVAASAVVELTSALTAGAKAIFDYSVRMEQTKIGFTTLMGGAEQANKHLKDLQKFAQETPFEFEDLTVASRRLQNVGLEAEKVIPVMRDIGNAAAAAGASSAELDSISLAFSQIVAKGKVSAEEVNQLAERGIPIWKILSEELGKTKAEIIDLSEKGKISSEIFLEAFGRFSRATFGDAMQKQSRTFAGAMSTIKDITTQTAATAFKPFYDEISKFAVNVATSLSNQQAKTNEAGLSFGSSLGTAIGVGLQQTGVGSDGYWKSIFFGPSAIRIIGEAAYQFGKDLGKSVRTGYNQGFAETATDASGRSFRIGPDGTIVYDAAGGTPTAGANQPPINVPGANTPAKVNTINVDRAPGTDQATVNEAYIENLKRILEREFDLWDANKKQILARMRADVEERKMTEAEFLTAKRKIEDEAAAKTIANMEAEQKKRREYGMETLDIDNKIKIANEKIYTEIEERRGEDAKHKRDDEKKELEHLEKKRKSWAEHIDQLVRVQELEDAAAQRRAEEEAALFKRQTEAADPAGDGTLLGGFAGAVGSIAIPDIFGGSDQMLSDAEFVTEVWGGVFESIGSGLGQMTQGLAQMGAAWLATGQFSAKAALQMASSVALSLAMQAGVAAIMEVARGWAESAASAASYAVGDVVGGTLHASAAALHFSSAAIYGTVAGVAAGVGVGLGLAARAAGGGSGGNQGSAAFQQQTTGNRNTAGQGEAYSPYGTEATVFEQGRNQAAPALKISIADDSQWLGKMLKVGIETNAGVRDLIKQVAES